MNKRYSKTLFRSFLTLSCILYLSLPAWAAEEGGPGADADVTVVSSDESGQDSRSRVITCGAGQTADTEEPGSVKSEASASETGKKGASLGMYTTTGYCNCSKCSGGHNLTYSGTVPRARHTISADLSVLPIGTRVMIGDVIYTVEDMGSSVNGNWIDIYYDNHEAAVAHGMKTEEVFAVEP